MKKLIVLDIDETLLYCDYSNYITNPDYVFTSDYIDYATIKRPHVDEFLTYIKENFRYGIYTAATRDYAENHIRNLKLNPAFLLSRENCTRKNVENGDVIYIKKLSKLKKYTNLSNMVAIDDLKESYLLNYGNLVQVIPFIGDGKDSTLLKLMKYLEDLKNVKDVRKVEKRGWISKY
jgi:TFIIF-interacting CTD phosphatase-like protein